MGQHTSTLQFMIDSVTTIRAPLLSKHSRMDVQLGITGVETKFVSEQVRWIASR